jgi:hypothetical protein
MLVWNFPGAGPQQLPGQLFVAAQNTAAAYTAGTGMPVNYTGMVLYNPPTVAGQPSVRLVPIRVSFVPEGTSTSGSLVSWGIIKSNGTCTPGLSAFNGYVSAAGYPGVGTWAAGFIPKAVGQVGGTATWLNGTAATYGPNAVNYVEHLGVAAFGTGITAQSAPPTIIDLHGEISLAPGEAMAISPWVACVAVGSIAWVEISNQSGQ